MPNIDEKYTLLKDKLTALGRVAVAFSGGTDSALLLKVAHDVLGENAIAVSAILCSNSEIELQGAEEFCRKYGINRLVFEMNELSLPAFANNLPDRCYFCKKDMFENLTALAEKEGFYHIIEGSNSDDVHEHRPGFRAIRELGIKSPLLDVGLTKTEVRNLSKKLEIPTWDKPATPCLATRIPTGQPITVEKLRMVEMAEAYLGSKGFSAFRVRHHGDLARIELSPKDFEHLKKLNLCDDVTEKFKTFGFSLVALDLV